MTGHYWPNDRPTQESPYAPEGWPDEEERCKIAGQQYDDSIDRAEWRRRLKICLCVAVVIAIGVTGWIIDRDLADAATTRGGETDR